VYGQVNLQVANLILVAPLYRISGRSGDGGVFRLLQERLPGARVA
jgi:hypothetical protein